MGILANFPAFVKSKVVYKNRYAIFTNRSLSWRWIWYNMTTTKGWGKPMPGEYSRMMERCTRDTSFCRAATNHAGTTQVNTEESPDTMSGLLPLTAEKGTAHRPFPTLYHINARSSSVKRPLVLTMALSPSSGGWPPHTLTTSPPASRRISQPAAMSQGLVPNSNWPSARPQAM